MPYNLLLLGWSDTSIAGDPIEIGELPFGKRLQFANWKMAHLEMVYLLNMVIFHSYVSLPEGNHSY
jgi:hypothetical protein